MRVKTKRCQTTFHCKWSIVSSNFLVKGSRKNGKNFVQSDERDLKHFYKEKHKSTFSQLRFFVYLHVTLSISSHLHIAQQSVTDKLNHLLLCFNLLSFFVTCGGIFNSFLPLKTNPFLTLYKEFLLIFINSCKHMQIMNNVAIVDTLFQH